MVFDSAPLLHQDDMDESEESEQDTFRLSKEFKVPER